MNRIENKIRWFVLSAGFLLGLGHIASAQALQPPVPGSFAYVLQADSFAKNKASAIQRLAGSGRDWIVLDAGLRYGAGELAEPLKLTAGRKRHALVVLG